MIDLLIVGREKGLLMDGEQIVLLINNNYVDMIKDSIIDNSIYGSDHCPIIFSNNKLNTF